MNYDQIKQLVTGASDPAYYKGVRAKQMYVSGLYDPEKPLLSQVKTTRFGGWLEDWEPQVTDNFDRGINNHAIINHRIMVQSTVFPIPQFIFPDIQDSDVAAYNEQWLLSRWKYGNWGQAFYDAGISGYEPAGIGLVEIGLERFGADKQIVALRSLDPTDVVWDLSSKNPDEWQWVCVRSRLTYRQFLEKYGHNFEDPEKKFLDLMSPISRREGEIPSGVYTGVVTEWAYWEESKHCTLLGADPKKEDMFAASNVGGSYKYGPAEYCGENMFGVVPISAWIDMYAPCQNRPTGKAGASYRSVAQQNLYEKRLRQTVDNAPPITVISTAALDGQEDLVKFLKAGKPLHEWHKPILCALPNPENVIHRIPGAPIEMSLLSLMPYYQQQVNAATGVADAFRGQAVSKGEAVTAREIQMLDDQSGTQIRHMRNTYMQFLSRTMRLVRFIGSMYDTASISIVADGVEYDDEVAPQKAMLRPQTRIYVAEESMQFASKESRDSAAVQKFMQVVMPFVQLGVVDPMQAWGYLTKKLQDSQLERLTFSEEQQMANSALAQQGVGTESPAANEMLGTMPQ